ncbi:hypothetical protein [Chitinimonas sp.]|uniref:hypothetical protein n=1 Tax=Chitinimonas sp. TaxID=1934313 RepID=UPI0035B3F812
MTASQSIPIPQNAIATYLFMVGGGGGGYFLGTAGSGGASGAIGAFVIDHRRVGVTNGGSVAIGIGAGGVGSNAGGSTTVSIGSLTLTAQGGQPAQSNNPSTPGSMLTVVGVDLQFWAGRAINLLGGLYVPTAANPLLNYGANGSSGLGVTGTSIINAPGGNSGANGGSHAALVLPYWVKAAGIALGTPGNVSASNGGGAASFNGAGGNGGGTSATGFGGGGGAGSSTAGAPGCVVICFEVPA